ncbi:MAG: TolC family protein [Bacteroidota bacterium]
MKIPLVKSRSEINDCPPLRCDKKHRKAALNVVGTKQRIRRLLFFISVIVCMPVFVYSQNEEKSDSTQFFTLEQCIHYAMQHQPGLNRSLLNTSIAKTTNAINLSGWLPQVNLIGSMIHYNQLPMTLAANPVPGGPPVPTPTGVAYTALPELSASQAIFQPQLLYAATSASLFTRQAEQITDSMKIYVVSSVSKSFYNLLLTLEEIDVLKEDTARLGRNILDTYNQYVGGIVDETDHEQAVITLNNSKAQLKQAAENVAPEYAALKQLMGYPPEKNFNVAFDTTQMLQEIYADTTTQLQYENRIEYQQLQTIKELQHQQTIENELSFLPSVSVFYNYYYEYESPSSSTLFKTAYPYSYFGVSLSFPIFTGFARVESVQRSKLQEQVVQWDEVNLKSQIYTEYSSALANYKSNLYNLRLLDDNKSRAQNVYRVVSLQYNQGVVAYLNLLVAESNLISAEIGYIDALFQLLSSKIDLEKAMGAIPSHY